MKTSTPNELLQQLEAIVAESDQGIRALERKAEQGDRHAALRLFHMYRRIGQSNRAIPFLAASDANIRNDLQGLREHTIELQNTVTRYWDDAWLSRRAPVSLSVIGRGDTLVARVHPRNTRLPRNARLVTNPIRTRPRPLTTEITAPVIARLIDGTPLENDAWVLYEAVGNVHQAVRDYFTAGARLDDSSLASRFAIYRRTFNRINTYTYDLLDLIRTALRVLLRNVEWMSQGIETHGDDD